MPWPALSAAPSPPEQQLPRAPKHRQQQLLRGRSCWGSGTPEQQLLSPAPVPGGGGGGHDMGRRWSSTVRLPIDPPYAARAHGRERQPRWPRTGPLWSPSPIGPVVDAGGHSLPVRGRAQGRSGGGSASDGGVASTPPSTPSPCVAGDACWDDGATERGPPVAARAARGGRTTTTTGSKGEGGVEATAAGWLATAAARCNRIRRGGRGGGHGGEMAGEGVWI